MFEVGIYSFTAYESDSLPILNISYGVLLSLYLSPA